MHRRLWQHRSRHRHREAGGAGGNPRDGAGRPRGPCVIAANHASYLDGIILTAVLPGVFSFVAKREFTERLVARVFLQNIGTEFVERFALARGVEDARGGGRAARRGRTLVFFPEGTFTRTPG